MIAAWRTKPRTLRERLALWLIGETPVMANVRIDRPAGIEGNKAILARRVDLGEAFYAQQPSEADVLADLLKQAGAK